ncbi:MAG: SBBP repeat-containing protein, partial [Candidatus Sulfotelmatobacter sp.]
PNSQHSNSRRSRPDAQALLGQLPLIFEPNQGQADPSVKFLSQGAGYTLLLDSSGAMLGLRTAHSAAAHSEKFIRMKLVGANLAATASGTNPLPGKSNYLIGNDPQKWHTSIPQFAGVQYTSVYPGIDLVFYGNQGHLEYDFRVAPGADPSQAELQFDGAAQLELNHLKLNHGDLILSSKDAAGLRLKAPQIYQLDGDRRTPVAGRFVLRAANRVAFAIGKYDHSRELVIDPLLTFATYFGGSGSETLPSIAVNGDGSIYLAGSTTSPPSSFPLGTTAPVTVGTATNVFIAKILPTQPPSVAYATFFGGNGADASVGLGVDSGGNAYVVGNTTSTNFPVTGSPYQSSADAKGSQCTGITCTSVFVSVLSPTGASFTYSSYLSGNGNDQANGMAIDTNRDVFIVGNTTSTQPSPLPTNNEFPATQVPAPFQATPLAPLQFFITKVNTGIPGTGSIAYSTYFGGSNPANAIAIGGGIAADASGNIYFSGATNFYNSGSGIYGDSGSGDFPILNAYQPCLDTVPPTILNNPNPCSAPASTPYPTDAFIAKINPNGPAGDQLLFSTYLGGSANDTSASLAIDSGAANIYITGATNSPDFVLPTGSQAFQTCLDTPPPNPVPCPAIAAPAANDAYVAKFSNPTPSTTGVPNDVGFTYFSYLGGAGTDSGMAIAVLDASSTTLGDVALTGSTNSSPFPVTSGPIQSTLAGAQNAFYAQIDTTAVTGQNGLGAYVTYFGGNGTDRGTSVAVDPVSQAIYFAGDTTSTNLPTVNPLQPTLTGPSNDFLVKLTSAPDICIATCPAPVVSPLGIVPAGNQATVTFSVTNGGPDVATGITVSGGVNSTGVTFVSGTAASGSCSTPVNNSVVCTIPSLQVGSTSTVKFVVTPTTAGNFDTTATVLEVNNTNTNIVASASITASDYSVTVNPSGRIVLAGGIASYLVTVSPTSVFADNVSLSCGNIPSATSCNFTNSTLNLTNGNSSTTLNILTTAQPITTVASASWRHPFYALWLMAPGMAFLTLGKRKNRKKRVTGLFAITLFFGLVLLQPSCSGNRVTPPPAGGTPSGTYSLTVTATSGSVSRSAPLQLTVNP